MTAPALAITALSPVATAAVFCRLAGTLWATVVVKATFQLVHGEPARLVTPLDLVLEDRASPANGSLERARETAPHMANAGLLLSGHASAPGGRAVPSMSVRLGVSRDKPLIDKTLHVFGARVAAAPAAITPFLTMPLVYERAFGGAGVWDNPVGTGGPGSSALPNIVDPRDPRRASGFGPIAPQWAPRRALSGGVDPAVLAEAVWDVPAGFDWRFFQAAPVDQQVERFRGDEWILLEGMHPGLPRVQSRLPQVTALARRRVPSSTGVAEQPVELRADMLVIDADRLSASLVWRGRFTAPSPEVLARTQVLVGIERPGQSITWPAASAAVSASYSTETQEIHMGALLGAAVPFSPGRGSAPHSISAGAKPAPLFTGTAAVDVRAILREPVPFADARETTELRVASELLREPVGTVAMPEGIRGADSPALPFARAELSRPPSEAIATPAARKPTPIPTGTTDIDLAEVLRGATPPRGPAAKAPPAVAPPEVVAPPEIVAPPEVVALPQPAPAAPLPSAAAPVRPVGLSEAEEVRATPPPPPAGIARSRADATLAERSVLDGEDFEGADLSGLDLSGRSLRRCKLRGARLRGTNLAGAKLAGAVLDEADLRGAVLCGADLKDASLRGADLERADLSGCHAGDAMLAEANLQRADLHGASFVGASFEGAVLRDVVATDVELVGARMDRADLSAGSFRRAKMARVTLEGANLDRADFRGADLEGAQLTGASLRMTKLAGARWKGVDKPPSAEAAAVVRPRRG